MAKGNHKIKNINILFIGCGYFPFKVCSDKNYFFNLLPLLHKKFNNIVVFSINDHEQPISYQNHDYGQFPIYNIKRSFHFSGKKYHVKTYGNNFYYNHKHQLYREIPEIFLTFLFNMRLLSKLISKYDIQIINFMDNCGPAMRYIKTKFPDCFICYSAMNYNKRLLYYDSAIKFYLKSLDHVIPYTHALYQKYTSIGLQRKQLSTIPWGTKIKKDKYLYNQRTDIRNLYMQSTDNVLFLWTGFIQQIGERDFSFTLDLAHQLAKRISNAEFLFSFKPEFQTDAQNYSTHHPRVKILNKVDNFEKLLANSDFLLSPIEKTDSIIAPPLTWIESINLGTPIITTAVNGASEIINNGQTGFIAGNYEELPKIICNLLKIKSSSSLKKTPSVILPEKYDIKNSAKKYFNLYNNLINNNG